MPTHGLEDVDKGEGGGAKLECMVGWGCCFTMLNMGREFQSEGKV